MIKGCLGAVRVRLRHGLTEHGCLEVAGHDVARVFRDYRNGVGAVRLWVSAGRAGSGCEISDAGARTLEALLAENGAA